MNTHEEISPHCSGCSMAQILRQQSSAELWHTCINKVSAARPYGKTPLSPASWILMDFSRRAQPYVLSPPIPYLHLQWGGYLVPVPAGFPWACWPLLEVPRLNNLHFALCPAPSYHLCCLHDSGQETLAAQRHRGRHHWAVLCPSQKE